MEGLMDSTKVPDDGLMDLIGVLSSRAGFNMAKFPAAFSSSFTLAKNSQVMQDICFCANVPCTLPPQNVPVTAQQILPPF